MLEPYDNPFWDFSKGIKKSKKINTKNSGPAKFAPLVARTSLGPIWEQSRRWRKLHSLGNEVEVYISIISYIYFINVYLTQ